MKERELPEGWEWVKANEIIELHHGFQFREYDFTNDGLPVVKITQLGRDGLLDLSNPQFISKDRLDEFQDILIKPNDVLLTLTGGTLGKTVWVDRDYGNIVHNYRVGRLIPKNSRILPRFLYFLIISDTMQKQIFSRINESAQPNLGKAEFENFIILLPPLLIQRQIVAVLEQAEAVKRQRQEADALTGALLQSIFMKMFDDPVSNPKGWDTKKLGDLCTIRRGASPRPIDDYLGGTVPWIKIGDGTKGSDIFIDSTSEKIIEAGVKRSVLLKKGSLIFANCGVSLGFARILNIEGCIHDGWLSLEDIDPSLNKIYLLKLINGISQHFRNIAPDGTQPNLNTGIMKNFLIPLPPLALQQQFARVVQDVERIREQQVASGKEIDGLCEGLMQRAFAGELVA